MKRRIFSILVLLILAALACRYTPTPTPAPTTPPTQTPVPPSPTLTATPTQTPTPALSSSSGLVLRSLHLFTVYTGWALGEDGLYRTQDGGLSWQPLSVPDGQVGPSTSIYFRSDKEIRVLLPAPDGTGLLDSTTDGGQTWTSAPAPQPDGVLTFSRDDETAGYIIHFGKETAGSQSVNIYQTLDSGQTWNLNLTVDPLHPGTDNLPFAGKKTGASFDGAVIGWISGFQPVTNDIYLYQTNDAARTWRKLALDIPASLGDISAVPFPPVFVDDQNGFIRVDLNPTSPQGQPASVFYASPDGGKTWAQVSQLPLVSATDFLDAQTGWAWSGQRLYATSDGAHTWTVLPTALGVSERASDIDFVDVNNGWMLTLDSGNHVRLYRTNSGGGTWTALIP